MLRAAQVTTSLIEWAFVSDPDKGLDQVELDTWPGTERMRQVRAFRWRERREKDREQPKWGVQGAGRGGGDGW